LRNLKLNKRSEAKAHIKATQSKETTEDKPALEVKEVKVNK
jgi:hypothetical protein